MKALNEALMERKVDARYVTLCVLLWDPRPRQIVMANAGAMPPMICRGGEILNMRVEGVPLGLLDAREYDEVTFQAQPGDIVVLYSDGITDHLNAAGPGVRPRPATHIAAHSAATRTACEIVDAIFRDLDNFTTTAFDDQTVFALKVK